jgi:hypothetical protein
MWKENRFGWPLRGIIWFTFAIIGSCAIIALLAGYEQTTSSLETISHRVPPWALEIFWPLTYSYSLLMALFSYQALAIGAVEANPVVAAAIVNWGMVWGLIYNKGLACLLLLLIFPLRRSRRLLTMRALTVTASVYVCAIIVCLWELVR